MFARKWKTRCPLNKKDGFIKYLHQTGVKDTSSTSGFQGAQIFTRNFEEKVEVTLITYWDSLESIKAFAGNDISVARLYSEDYKYELDPDFFVTHYKVEENQWL
jgi:heme-degrading monooxygenase HmoA